MTEAHCLPASALPTSALEDYVLGRCEQRHELARDGEAMGWPDAVVGQIGDFRKIAARALSASTRIREAEAKAVPPELDLGYGQATRRV